MYYRSVLHRPAESPKMNVSCLQLHFLEGGWCRWWYAFNGPYSKSENYFLHIIGTSLFATGILPKEIEVIVFCPLPFLFETPSNQDFTPLVLGLFFCAASRVFGGLLGLTPLSFAQIL